MQSNKHLAKFAQVIIMAAFSDDQKVVNIALTYSKAAIRFPISAWKMSADPANPIGNL